MRRPDRRLIVAIAACLVLLLGLQNHAASDPRPPNVIFIFLDDSGYGDTSVYGQREWQTPNIDRLAREGARFTNFHVPSRSVPPRAPHF